MAARVSAPDEERAAQRAARWELKARGPGVPWALDPLLDPAFSESSYGFRPGRSAPTKR